MNDVSKNTGEDNNELGLEPRLLQHVTCLRAANKCLCGAEHKIIFLMH